MKHGDGAPDAIAARVIVPAAPSAEEAVAAANIAARFGFETMALTLRLVVRDGDAMRDARGAVPILVGRRNQVVQRLVESGRSRPRDQRARDVRALRIEEDAPQESIARTLLRVRPVLPPRRDTMTTNGQ